MKFFHKTATTRKKFQKIEKLRDEDGTEVSNQEGLCNIAQAYFEKLFEVKQEVYEVLSCIPQVISSIDNHSLTAPVTKMELYEALLQMHPDKSSGLDGFNLTVYQIFWELCGDVFTVVFDKQPLISKREWWKHYYDEEFFDEKDFAHHLREAFKLVLDRVKKAVKRTTSKKTAESIKGGDSTVNPSPKKPTPKKRKVQKIQISSSEEEESPPVPLQRRRLKKPVPAVEPRPKIRIKTTAARPPPVIIQEPTEREVAARLNNPSESDNSSPGAEILVQDTAGTSIRVPTPVDGSATLLNSKGELTYRTSSTKGSFMSSADEVNQASKPQHETIAEVNEEEEEAVGSHEETRTPLVDVQENEEESIPVAETVTAREVEGVSGADGGDSSTEGNQNPPGTETIPEQVANMVVTANESVPSTGSRTKEDLALLKQQNPLGI
ncbi:unnamed protein product [Vicia faba]|uniref:Uncharacterized protein n=1 Tax=Vicia faba TaxID=3906 RepID=A0AAV1AKE7_VICFA|nr:unnamed protein product [Vicia faba]